MIMLGQITSMIGMILTIASFQMKTRKQIIIFQTVGSAFFLISYFLLGSRTAVYLNMIYLTRNFVFYFRKDYKWARHKSWIVIFLVAVVIAGVVGFRSWMDILPIFGAVFATIAMYMQSENMLRLWNILASPCWLIYNISVPSTGGVICEIFNMISIIVGLIRYKKDGVFTKKQ